MILSNQVHTTRVHEISVYLVQILVTELGDETFIIAAIMAMRHPRLVVYVGAMSALVSMTVMTSLLVPWRLHCKSSVCYSSHPFQTML